MEFSSEIVQFNPQCEDSDRPGSLSFSPLLCLAALFLLQMKTKKKTPIFIDVIEAEVEEVDINPPEDSQLQILTEKSIQQDAVSLPSGKPAPKKLEAIRVPSIQQGDLRQSIIYALAEFGPQTAKNLLNTLSDDFPDLPLKGKQGVGLNSHLYSMKKDKVLGTSDASPPVWFVIET